MLISVKPGCIITKTPAKPKIIANNLLKNIFSFKKIIASKVANIGAVFPIAATSDSVEVERALNQKNKAKAFITDLTKCICIRFVRSCCLLILNKKSTTSINPKNPL